MAKLISNIFLLLLFCFHYHLNTAKSATDFIKSECRATRYPDLCVRCLSNYSTAIQQSQRNLAEAAISVSLTRAVSAASFVSKVARMTGLKPAEYGAVNDCKRNMGDSVDQLSRSVKELDGIGQQNFEWHVSNVQTWVSTALTNANTCLDAFARAAMDGKVKVAIRTRVLDCARVTSNALALVNRFAARHNKARRENIP